MTIRYFDTPEVEITSLYFRSTKGKQRLESFPKKMVYGGREYTFIEQGMRYLVEKGQELVKLFDVSDGHNQFRLRLDNANHWTLVDMKELA
ncbi:MAG: hypothetical protein JWO41_814 [Candidatus Saccharibacteria bacterium]|nr:hypothetical protein [Candidatus Saccharibacteria bacterium]